MPDRIDDLRNQLVDALVEEGVYDRTTAEAVLNVARTRRGTIVGNFADLQRMGAVAVSGEIPTPPGEDNEETGDIQAAFKEPPESRVEDDPAYIQANASASGSQEGDGGGDTAAATADTGDGGDGGLESMTKAQLLDEANRRGVDVNSSMTKAEIIDAMGGE